MTRGWRLPRSLQTRLLGLVVGGVVAVWLATAVLTWADVRDELDELLDAHLAQAAALLVAQQSRVLHVQGDGDAEGVGEGDRDDDRHTIDAPALHRWAQPVVFQVFHEGRLVLRSANAPPAPMVAPGEGFRTGLRSLQIEGTRWRVFAAYGAERDVQVYVGEQSASRGEILRALLGSMLWPMAVALPILALAAWWAIFQGLRPLKRLERTLAARDPQALQAVATEGAPSEMVPMIEALNGLFGRIGALLETERRFTADAAHELRTPIAAIRTQAQVALNETDDALRRHALAATLQGCDRAARLVDQLLTLSRLEAAAAPASQSVDLSAVARRVVADIAPRALARQQTLSLDAPVPCAVAGDETLLGVLVRNLADNAVRYSPNGARVQVTVQRDGAAAVLTVEDSGPGLAAEDLARLGQRFFRVLGGHESGSGLGWSIVRRIAAAHGMTIETGRSAELGGLRVQVRAPTGRA